MMDIDFKKTGENIEKLMKEKGLKPIDIAYKLGTSVQTVYNWINGRSPLPLVIAYNIAGMLNVGMNDFIAFVVQVEKGE